jgi:hypothetical protein
VQLPRTPEFDFERETYRLRFCCEDCGHFDARNERCGHEWPNEQHRSDRVASTVDFCKEFELC